ncbi:MAG: efflux RND transporter periplasmic adaptor subunit [Magnetococcales bacterium]|nr:efflux RND transporter periplasmic adaptor subunit [Magnetococcales bacterium]
MNGLRPFFALLLFGMVASPLPSHAAGGEERAALTVTLTQPTLSPWPRTLQVSGGIHPWQEMIVAAEIGGLPIIALPVDVGSVVKKGDELARLSDATLQTTLAHAKANLTRAKAALAQTQADRKRVESVQAAGAFPEKQVTQYRLSFDAASAEVAAAQAALEQETVRLHQTRILAADDGVIATRTATLGAVVQTGTELFRLVRQNRLEWRAEVTDSQLAYIRPGQKAILTTTNGTTLEATARLIGPTLNPETRKGLVYFDLPTPSTLKAGMFARGAIQLGDEPALTLPQSAFVFHDGYTYLFELPKESDRVVRRKVTTDRQQENRLEITTGLEKNAQVVATGGSFLKDGDRVRIAEQKP